MTRFILVALLAGCAGSTSRPTPAEAPRDHIKIPHDVHAKAEVKCIACHEGVYDETALGTAAEALPKEETCLQCHQEQKDKNNCGFCHTDPQHAAPFTVAQGSVVMSHAKHIERVKEDCTVCHAELPNPLWREGLAPKMDACLSCHEHQVEFDNGRCGTCHKDLRDRKSVV